MLHIGSSKVLFLLSIHLKLREVTFLKSVFSPRAGIFEVKIQLTVVFRFWQRLSCINLGGSNSIWLITEGGSWSGQAEHLGKVLRLS